MLITTTTTTASGENTKKNKSEQQTRYNFQVDNLLTTGYQLKITITTQKKTLKTITQQINAYNK